MTNLEKQQMQINEFERINRSEKYYAKHGKPYELLLSQKKQSTILTNVKKQKLKNPQKSKRRSSNFFLQSKQST